MKILRHKLKITDYQTLVLKPNSTILSVKASRHQPNTHFDLWTLESNMDNPTCIDHGIYVIGTGNPVPDELNAANAIIGMPHFLDTIVTPINLVWHIFEGPVQH